MRYVVFMICYHFDTKMNEVNRISFFVEVSINNLCKNGLFFAFFSYNKLRCFDDKKNA